MHTDLDALIAAEAAFFRDHWDSAPDSATLARYRAETVAERRLRLAETWFHRLQGCVAHGPFEGLRLDANPHWGKTDLCAMLLGTYEPEVMRFLKAGSVSGRKQFVDIGAADGYFAIGALRSGWFNSACCYELTAEGQATIARVAEANGVADRMSIFGEAKPQFYLELEGQDWSDTVLLCDIEGGEFELFDEATLAALAGADILIEVHNWISDFWQRYTALLKRASGHFEIETFARRALPESHLDILDGESDDNRMLMLSEGRPSVMRYLRLRSGGL